MTKQILKVGAIVALMSAPLLVSALNVGPCPTGVNCTNTSITGLIILVINWLLAIAGLIAVLFLIIGGFWYITSAGNEETAEKGKNTAINAIIGIIIIILSWVIVNVVSNLVTNNNSGNTGP